MCKKSRFFAQNIALSLLLCLSSVALAKRERHEREYQEEWCHYATEHRLSDGSRVDCLTPYWAIEIDFAEKWAECVGQALHYSAMTGKQPACVLIVERDNQCRYIERLKSATRKLPGSFKFWLIGAAANRCQ